MQFLAQKYPNSIYGMGKFEFEPNLIKQELNRGLIAKLAKLHLIKGPIAKMVITTVFSSSKYPKIIYGMPLFEKLTKIRFEFEFKFKFDLNRKEKKKRKRKRKGLRPSWAGLGREGPSSSSLAQVARPALFPFLFIFSLV